MMLNRISGVVVAALGLLLLIWVIPAQTEPVDSGWLRPSTMPRLLAIVIALSGVFQVIFPAGQAECNPGMLLKIGFFFCLCLAALYLMGRFGFVYTAPALAMVIMALIGERRPVWLISGILIVPAVIWVLVTQVLNRPLP